MSTKSDVRYWGGEIVTCIWLTTVPTCHALVCNSDMCASLKWAGFRVDMLFPRGYAFTFLWELSHQKGTCLP